MVSFLDNEGLRYYDERLKVWVEAKVGESSSISDGKIKELDEKVKTKVANSLDMSLDGTTYVLTVKLLSESGEELSKATVDLPIEELIKDGRYDDTTKEIVLILESGTEIRVPVGDLVENKLDKTNTNYVLYGTTSTGEDGRARQSELPFRTTATNNSIAQRTSDGRLKVNAPTEADDSVNLQYLNENVLINQNDSTNAYYPKDKNNSINGKNAIVGSKGYKISETNFHEGSFGYLLFKRLVVPEIALYKTDEYGAAKKIRCYQYNDMQEFTVVDMARDAEQNETLMYVVNEMPYFYSADVYGFTKVEFCDDSGKVLLTHTNAELKTLWYGCVCENIHVIPRELTLAAEEWVEVDETGEYKVKDKYKKAMYYIDMPETPNIVNEPTCIKINNNYDSGTRQYYIDRGFKKDLSDAEDCLVAQGLNIDDNSYLVLTLGAFHGHKGWGLVGKPTFSEASHIRFPDHPEIGDAFVGNGFDNVLGYNAKATFDYGFSTGYNNNSLGRYSITGGTRNIAAYASVALGNHNSAMGQNGFAVGATNTLTAGASCSAVLGQENTIYSNACLVGGRKNEAKGKYIIAAGYGNKIEKDSSTAFGYTNTLNGEGEFAAGIGNVLNGRSSACLGAVNQSLGNYSLIGGYTNKTTTAYNFLAGLHNTVEWATCSTALGNENNIKSSDKPATDDGLGHLATGSSNTIIGGRNVVIGGQSCRTKLRDSVVIGNNLIDETGSYGKAIFGNYNKASYASIILGSGNKVDNRKNAFEVYSNGKVITPNATGYTDSDTYRLTTKQYVDNKVANALILTSLNGTKYRLTVDDSGNLSTEKVN